ncbi:MAG: TMEM165/GDT1 family protein [Thermodesulfobacteriota bacterium]|nr:TMEM165/GDT1 family protein [Thermodesulfobacteriota bacterium]
MDIKIFFTIFSTIFLAEIGDKTQLATVLFASDKGIGKPVVFLAASMALMAATAIGVLGGSIISHYVDTKYLHYLAGLGFIVIGVFTIYKA